ncbi:hypothetical protein CFP56_005418 [Quercus suber]|uniref:Uncharacterized protein n=1 Tax=Quercus suber TaxID=58331 RepID=A0AAW0LD24_QUESU
MPKVPYLQPYLPLPLH